MRRVERETNRVFIRTVPSDFLWFTAACLGPRRGPMACCGQSGADRFEAGEIEDRRAARAGRVGDRYRDPAVAPGSDGLGGVLRKGGCPPILGEQPTEVYGFLAISLQGNVDIARARRSPGALGPYRDLGAGAPAA
jgi:hypothetical protein